MILGGTRGTRFDDLKPGVERLASEGPKASMIRGIAPNPSRGTIAMDVGVGPSGGRHALIIYDVRGRRVRTLLDSEMQPGWYRVGWDQRDETGARATPGVYFLRLEAPRFAVVRKVVVLE